MPVFLDNHPAFELPPGLVVAFLRAARNGVRDGYGVLPLDFFCGVEGAVYCVVDAPGAESVRRSHGEQGLACGAILNAEDMSGLGAGKATPEELDVAYQVRRRAQDREEYLPAGSERGAA